MVSTISMMALGSAGVCALLSLNFYRKYRSHLRVEGRMPAEYARIADYRGVPLALAFQYRSEVGNSWSEVEVDVDEIYHYGPDYFVRGFGVTDRKGRAYKGSRIAHLRLRSDGRSLHSVAALLGEVAGQTESGAHRGAVGKEMGSAIGR